MNEKLFYDNVLLCIEKLLSNNGFSVEDKNTIDLQQMSAYYSCIYRGSIFFRVHFGKKVQWVEIPGRYHKIVSKYFPEILMKDGFCRISLVNTDCGDYLGNMLNEVLENIMDNCSHGFGCCDKYIECSNAGKCVLTDKRFAADCSYRINLKNGKIFYGKNKNI